MRLFYVFSNNTRWANAQIHNSPEKIFNELVEPSPNLPINDTVDSQTLKAVSDFRKQWYSRLKVDLSTNPFNEINYQLWAMIGKALYTKETLIKELKDTEDREIRSLLLGLDFVRSVSIIYTAQMQACDEKIARIFGGENAVAAANGFDPESLAVVHAYKYGLHAPYYRGDDIKDDGKIVAGHLGNYAMHLYGSSDNTRFGVDGNTYTDLYVPDGFRSPETIRKVLSPEQAGVEFFYKKLGNYENVTLLVFHIKDFKLRKDGNRWHLGKIGGKSGDGVDYIHSHLDLLKGDVGMTGKRIRIGFADGFC